VHRLNAGCIFTYSAVIQRFDSPADSRTSHQARSNSSHTGCKTLLRYLKCVHQQTNSTRKGNQIMNATTKALMFGAAIALAGLGAVSALTQHTAVVKLEPVVVTAKRLPAQEQIVKLGTVEVTASRVQLLAAQAQEDSKQAAAASNPRI
jgi:hypothetical protein